MNCLFNFASLSRGESFLTIRYITLHIFAKVIASAYWNTCRLALEFIPNISFKTQHCVIPICLCISLLLELFGMTSSSCHMNFEQWVCPESWRGFLIIQHKSLGRKKGVAFIVVKNCMISPCKLFDALQSNSKSIWIVGMNQFWLLIMNWVIHFEMLNWMIPAISVTT